MNTSTALTPTSSSRILEDAPPVFPSDRYLLFLCRPASLLILALLIHVLARAASFNHYQKVDSYTLGIAAYKMWRPDAVFEELVVDKPPGQGLLTGWIYHVFPDPPSRLALIPIESAFLLGAYIVFWLVARRFVALVIAAAATLFFAIAHNAYNVLDFVTDGFNLGESYLALPLLLAVLAHVTTARPGIRGLLQGMAIGTALTIKQSALGLCAVLFIHELWTQRKALPLAATAVAATIAGIIIALLPSVLFLMSHGWLTRHVRNLWRYTSVHGQVSSFSLPPWYNIEPLLPCLCWLLIGLLAVAFLRKSRSDSGLSPDDVQGNACPMSGAVLLLTLWAFVELAILWSLTKPASHYYQQLTMPIALLAGLAFNLFLQRAKQPEATRTFDNFRWVAVVTAVLTFVSVRPILTEASRRIPTFDYQREVDDFQVNLKIRPVVGVRLPETQTP